jgi:hypothetical protein
MYATGAQCFNQCQYPRDRERNEAHCLNAAQNAIPTPRYHALTILVSRPSSVVRLWSQ